MSQTAAKESDPGSSSQSPSPGSVKGLEGSTTPPPPGEPDVPEHTKLQLTLILVALCLAVFLAAVDATLITAALPTIAKELGASDAGFAWIGSSYLLSLAATAPFWSKVSDIFGRKPIILLANVVFLVGSLIAALSKNLAMLIAGRTVQGAGAGGLITLVEISVGDMFSPRERGLFYGIYGAVWAVATAIGPLIGGAFTERVTWRWCFWFNLPFDGLSLIITTIFLHIHNPKTPLLKGLAAIDWIGSLLIVGATLMFLLGLDFGGVSAPWDSAVVICLIIFGIVAYVLFGVYEHFARYPVIPRRIFGSVSLVSTFAVVFSHGACFMGPIFFLPLYFQDVLGASPIMSGVWLLPLAISFTVSGIVMGIVIERTGHYLWIIRGSMAVFTLALGLMITYGAERDWPRIIIFQIILAAGIGANMQTLVICVQALVAPEDIAVATGTLNFIRNLATAVSVVLGQVIIQGILATHQGDLLAAGIPSDVVDRLVHGGSISGAALTAGFSEEQRDGYGKAVADSLSKMWIFYTAFCALGFVVTFGIRGKELSTSHETTKTGLEAEEAKRQKNLRAQQSEETAINGEKSESA
ncbi:major facilitator superfamily-domain-containing protein [Biscogniauxia mediterranea]|nr:major facilitator superfamily-domain-containing protein [Biscogniauxia mediterranea]